jgi:hypothetical protein
MRRIVSLVGDPTRATAHFRELLRTAAQQFNAGSLPRATQILDLARRLLEEKAVDRASAELILGTAQDDLDPGQLMAQTQNPQNLSLLRRVLDFYPALSPTALLATLDHEPDRFRRRLWMTLLEVHGLPARRAALDRLESSFEEGAELPEMPWLQRNFVYLLHHIPPAPDEDLGREVRLCVRCCELERLAALVREALIDLGLRRHPEAEAALRQRLEQLERHLENPAAAPHEAAELRRMLALVVSGLIRHGSSTARRAAVEHGFKQRPQLGDTLERLTELGGSDLSEHPEVVERLLEGLDTLLPTRVLGVSLRRPGPAHHVVAALRSTPTPAVVAALRLAIKRYPREPAAAAAAAALASWSQATEAPAAAETAVTAPVGVVTLSGEIELFGLPDLLQTLAGTKATGRLVLRNRGGEMAAQLRLREGAVCEAEAGALGLPDAFYQLLERPFPGTFEFVREPPPDGDDAEGRDVMSLLLEGSRRYDELQRARALAPDQARLQPTGARPTAPQREKDGALIRELWLRVKQGATPRQCETAVAADSYRVRSLLAHWLTEGAIALGEGPTATAT